MKEPRTCIRQGLTKKNAIGTFNVRVRIGGKNCHKGCKQGPCHDCHQFGVEFVSRINDDASYRGLSEETIVELRAAYMLDASTARRYHFQNLKLVLSRVSSEKIMRTITVLEGEPSVIRQRRRRKKPFQELLFWHLKK